MKLEVPKGHPGAAEGLGEQADPQLKHLEVLVRARYPLLYLVSWEEARAEAMLRKLGESLGKKVHFWTVTHGLDDPMRVPDKDGAAPASVLETIGKSSQSALYVLKDFHPYLMDAKVVRGLRDLVAELKASSKTVILLSPVLTLPPELEKDLTVLDYDLPGPAELRGLIREISTAAKAHKRFTVEVGPEAEERFIQAALGMTLSEAENAFAKAIVIDGRLAVEDVHVIMEEKKQIIRKSRLLEYHEAREELGQVGGAGRLKDWLVKRGAAFSEKARLYGLPQPKGVLLLGVQGCGKSLTCKAISALWKLPLLRLDMGSIFGGFVGQSEENMRRAIRTAESIAPCVLWLDEIEKGLAGTQSSGSTDGGTTARVFSTFLTWLSEKTKPVFVAATANNIKDLPPELLRKGRLDEIFFIDLPASVERCEILGIHLRRKGRDPAGFDLEALAVQAEGFSGAELEEVVVSALHEGFAAGRDIGQADLVSAVGSMVPLARTMREDIEALRNWARERARPASSEA